MTRDKKKNILLHVLASVLVLIWAAVAIVAGGLSGLIGLHEVVIVERASGRVVVRGGAPAFEGERLLGLMRADAESLNSAEFLQKWEDPARWPYKVQNSKAGK